MKKKFIFILIVCLFYFIPIETNALNATIRYQTEDIEETSGPISHLRHMLFEKETRDAEDYILLAVFSVGLLIVIVMKNKKWYVPVWPKKNKFLEENNINLIEEIEIETNLEEAPRDIEKLGELKEDYATLVNEKKEESKLAPRSAKKYKTYSASKTRKNKEKDV